MKTKNLNENRFYVYVYIDTRKSGNYNYDEFSFDYEPFYIGKGKDNRQTIHLKPSKLKKNSPKNNKIKKIIKEIKEQPKIIILRDNLSEHNAFDLEKKLITLIGRHDLKKGPLTNLTNGGEGSSGRKVSEETIKKLSEANKGGKNPNYGKKLKPRSQETLKKMSEAHKGKKASLETRQKQSLNTSGKNNPNYGNPTNYKHSIETLKKLSKINKGENNSMYGKKHSIETKKQMSESKKGDKNPMYGKKRSKDAIEKLKKNNTKPIINDGGIVFESLKKASEYYNVSPSFIGLMLNGKRKNKFKLSFYNKTLFQEINDSKIKNCFETS